MTNVFEIAENITVARTPPSEFYLRAQYFELSKRQIFARSWQLAGRVSDVANLLPFTLLPGLLDEPLVFTKSGSGKISCLSNVCTHRGKLLVEGPCSAAGLRCGYHGRKFDLDGRFVSMPEFEGVSDFPNDGDNLTSVACGESNGFLFASLDPADDLDAFLAPNLSTEFTYADLELTESRDYSVNAHWALYCDNYLEGFHIPYVHPALNRAVDYGTYTTELFRYSITQTAFDETGGVAGKYVFVFPNLMFNFYPWGLSVNIVFPISPERTLVRFFTYIADAAKFGVGAGADLHTVELEDEAVVESVQNGIKSRFYRRGRYSPARESGTHHFHRLIAEFLSYPAAPESGRGFV